MPHLALIGPTNIGKTLNSYLEAKKLNDSVFLCRHLEDLVNYRKEEIIIFDDISFEFIQPEQLIKILDKDFHASVRILRQIVKIEPTVFKIFTHNEESSLKPLLATPQQLEAICRRLTVKKCQTRDEVLAALSEMSPMYTRTRRLHKLLR